MERSAGEGSLLRDPKVMVVLLRGQASFLNSVNRTHPTTLANSTSHFSLLVGESAGREGGVPLERKGGVAVGQWVGGGSCRWGGEEVGRGGRRGEAEMGEGGGATQSWALTCP